MPEGEAEEAEAVDGSDRRRFRDGSDAVVAGEGEAPCVDTAAHELRPISTFLSETMAESETVCM